MSTTMQVWNVMCVVTLQYKLGKKMRKQLDCLVNHLPIPGDLQQQAILSLTEFAKTQEEAEEMAVQRFTDMGLVASAVDTIANGIHFKAN